MSKLEYIFETDCHRVSSLRANDRPWKTCIWEKLFTSKPKKERRSRTKALVTWKMPKLAQKLEQRTSGRFYVAVGLFSINRSHTAVGRQNVVRTSVTHSPASRVSLFGSYHIFYFNGELLLNRHTTTWNLFVKCCFLITGFE